MTAKATPKWLFSIFAANSRKNSSQFCSCKSRRFDEISTRIVSALSPHLVDFTQNFPIISVTVIPLSFHEIFPISIQSKGRSRRKNSSFQEELFSLFSAIPLRFHGILDFWNVLEVSALLFTEKWRFWQLQNVYCP